MQIREDMKLNYNYLLIEKIDEINKDFDSSVTIGFVMVRTLTDMKILSPVDKMDLIPITARDMYNTACKIYEQERKIETKTTNRK